MVQTLIYLTSPCLIRSDHGKKSYKLSKAKKFKKFALFSSHTPKKWDFFYALSCSMLAYFFKSRFFVERDLGRKFGAKMVQALIYKTSPFLIRSDHGMKSYNISKAKTFKNLLFFVRIHRKKGIFSMLYHVSCSLFLKILIFLRNEILA